MAWIPLFLLEEKLRRRTNPYLVFNYAWAGFLVWNWPPARLFMGDAGSVPTGFLLGGLAVLGVAVGVDRGGLGAGGPVQSCPAAPRADRLRLLAARREPRPPLTIALESSGSSFFPL